MHLNPRTANLLGALAVALASRIERETSEVGGQGTTASAALVTIHNHPGESVEALRRTLGLTHSGAVRLLNGLEAEGLLERRRDDNDGRAVAVWLTAAGQERASAILCSRAEATDAVLGALPAEQLVLLVPMLETALAALTRGPESARAICRLCDEGVCRPAGCPVEQTARQHGDSA